MMLVPLVAQAADDPILFTVGDMPVTRSEFEQSYLKHTTLSRESRQTVADYLEMYIVYKLKVKAALDAHLDATSSFQNEYVRLADAASPQQEISPSFSVVPQEAYEWKLRSRRSSEVVNLAQILIRIPQKTLRDEQSQAQQQAEAIYRKLQGGADFGQLARQYSQDEKSAPTDGMMGWHARGQLLKEVEDVAFSLGVGEMSRPFLSTIGYHILLVKDRKTLGAHELTDGLESPQPVYLRTTTGMLAGNLIGQSVQTESDEGAQMPEDDLQREYYEGLLLYAQHQQSVGRQAAENEENLKYYFKKNKKKYRRKGFKPKDYTEVRELVVADLQEEMDKHWVADLRKRYPVNMNKKVLKTVNNHH